MTDLAFYNEMQELAVELIGDFGFSGSLYLAGSAGGIDDDGNYTAEGAPTVINCILTPVQRYKSNEIDGQNVQVGDGYVFVDSQTEPTINMTTTINNEEWRVVAVEGMTTNAGQKIYRKLQLRR